MRVVDDAGDAGVDAAEGGDQVADVMIVRTVMARETVVRRRHIFADRAVGNNSSKLSFPRVTVRVDEAWNDDRVGGVDHLSVRRRFQLTGRRDAGDLLSFDQHVSAGEIADFWIHRDDGPTFDQDVLRRDDALAPRAVERPGIVNRRRDLAEDGFRRTRNDSARKECRAGLEHIATLHESPPKTGGRKPIRSSPRRGYQLLQKIADLRLGFGVCAVGANDVIGEGGLFFSWLRSE